MYKLHDMDSECKRGVLTKNTLTKQYHDTETT